jgi:hypothetical protein
MDNSNRDEINNDEIKIDDSSLAELEAINDDFVEEIKQNNIKKLEEENKKKGITLVEEKEEELELDPLKVEEELADIKNLNIENVDEFLKNNNGKIEEEVVKEIKEEETDSDYKILDGLKDFKLNDEIWNEMNLNAEIIDKIKNRVKIEIRNFVLNDLVSVIKASVK